MKLASGLTTFACLATACSSTFSQGASTQSPQLFADDEPITALPASEPYVWCGEYNEGSFVISDPSVHVALWPRLDPGFDADMSDPDAFNGWIISARLGDIEVGKPIDLPLLWEAGQPSRAAVYARVQANEYSSGAASSSGTITFDTFPCLDSDETIEFSIDATLGAEDGGPDSIRMLGTFSGSHNEPPQRDFYNVN